MNRKVAILLTCHNRKDKTASCLASLFRAKCPNELNYTVFLVDDGCTDGTTARIRELYPDVNIIQGKGNLYWAGGMRLAWRTALASDDFDAFLLLNDDVELKPDFFYLLIQCHDYATKNYNKGGVYSAATLDKTNNSTSYGGQKIIKNSWRIVSRRVDPCGFPQEIDMTNANILWVEKNVVTKIGILSDRFTHGLADYDYSLRARKNNVIVMLASDYGGFCKNDHGKSFMGHDHSLRERLEYLRSPTGLAYSDYMFYVKKHFPFSLPYSFFMLWAKTIFPFMWEKFK